MAKKKITTYNAKWLSKYMKVSYNTALAKLRAANVQRTGKSYNFLNKSHAIKIAKKLAA